MEKTKKGIDLILISFIIISFLLFTTITVKNAPNIFCSFITWLGGCEDNYGKICN